MDIITVSASGKTVLKRIDKNLKFQLSTTEILEASAISFTLRGNALEGYEFEIKDSVIRDIDEVVAELRKEAAKL